VAKKHIGGDFAPEAGGRLCMFTGDSPVGSAPPSRRSIGQSCTPNPLDASTARSGGSKGSASSPNEDAIVRLIGASSSSKTMEGAKPARYMTLELCLPAIAAG
jgi:hypothetical protein